MIASPPHRTNYLRNDRLKAARDRQMAASLSKLRQAAITVCLVTAFATGAFFYYGCSLTTGCTSTPYGALQVEVVADLDPNS